MANAQRPESSSVFDDMLARNKKRFDDLYRGGSPHGGQAAAAKAPAGRATAASPASPSAELGPDSVAAPRLNERFGNDWRYEIAERRHAGDEVIVLCKLTFGKDGAVRTQFGRAKLSSGPRAGSSGQVRFRLGAAAAGSDDTDAVRRATEAALLNCIDLI